MLQSYHREMSSVESVLMEMGEGLDTTRWASVHSLNCVARVASWAGREGANAIIVGQALGITADEMGEGLDTT